MFQWNSLLRKAGGFKNTKADSQWCTALTYIIMTFKILVVDIAHTGHRFDNVPSSRVKVILKKYHPRCDFSKKNLPRGPHFDKNRLGCHFKVKVKVMIILKPCTPDVILCRIWLDFFLSSPFVTKSETIFESINSIQILPVKSFS